ncbi:hypothetical protein RRG08_062333 [Elysia crispata]|uniref:Uncharacterized protein n=1 Tax=Elysia crispata TaxID=231223 RepID=A0AAE0YGI4_9GAST|nr:hypothetical protein RRG08_062333 [Elysia crispata]
MVGDRAEGFMEPPTNLRKPCEDFKSYTWICVHLTHPLCSLPCSHHLLHFQTAGDSTDLGDKVNGKYPDSLTARLLSPRACAQSSTHTLLFGRENP